MLSAFRHMPIIWKYVISSKLLMIKNKERGWGG